jgi:hypothetical protein
MLREAGSGANGAGASDNQMSGLQLGPLETQESGAVRKNRWSQRKRTAEAKLPEDVVAGATEPCARERSENMPELQSLAPKDAEDLPGLSAMKQHYGVRQDSSEEAVMQMKEYYEVHEEDWHFATHYMHRWKHPDCHSTGCNSCPCCRSVDRNAEDACEGCRSVHMKLFWTKQTAELESLAPEGVEPGDEGDQMRDKTKAMETSWELYNGRRHGRKRRPTADQIGPDTILATAAGRTYDSHGERMHRTPSNRPCTSHCGRTTNAPHAKCCGKCRRDGAAVGAYGGHTPTCDARFQLWLKAVAAAGEQASGDVGGR